MMNLSDIIQASIALATVAAVIVAVWTLRRMRHLEHETASQTLIHAQYELCRVLDEQRVEFPETSHMLALPVVESDAPWANYLLFKSHVRTMFSNPGPISERDRASLYLKEHATALHVCDIYEQTLWQRSLAMEVNDEGRLKVLNALIGYYERCMLRNPRLRYHWYHGARDMMEGTTRARYDQMVQDAHGNDLVDFSSPLDDSNDLRRVADVAAMKPIRNEVAARLAVGSPEPWPAPSAT